MEGELEKVRSGGKREWGEEEKEKRGGIKLKENEIGVPNHPNA